MYHYIEFTNVYQKNKKLNVDLYKHCYKVKSKNVATLEVIKFACSLQIGI